MCLTLAVALTGLYQMNSKSSDTERPALLEGNNAVKMPVPVAKWLWPTTAVAVALTTFWGARNIEQQVVGAAPEILARAGVDIAGLEFNSTYRSVEVTGVLQEGITGHHIKTILTRYSGPNGEKIREVNVLEHTPANSEPASSDPEDNIPQIGAAVPLERVQSGLVIAKALPHTQTPAEQSHSAEDEAYLPLYDPYLVEQVFTELGDSAADEHSGFSEENTNQAAAGIETRIQFPSGTVNVPARANKVLDEIITTVLANPNSVIEIVGHTDSNSSAKYNLLLSQQRADAVATYIVAAGIESHRLTTTGHGDTRPIADNATKTGRNLNRRVEVRVHWSTDSLTQNHN